LLDFSKSKRWQGLSTTGLNEKIRPLTDAKVKRASKCRKWVFLGLG